MLDQRVKRIVAWAIPQELRDHSDNPWVRQFFRREAGPEAARGPRHERASPLLPGRRLRVRRHLLGVLLVMLGGGSLFQKPIIVETVFDESVQGLDVGSPVKLRGVIIGEVRSIGFTYTRYQLDKPISERLRYVMVEATILPRLLGGRAGAGDLTRPEGRQGRNRQGAARAPRAARHYRYQLSRDPLYGSRRRILSLVDPVGTRQSVHSKRAVDSHPVRRSGVRHRRAPAQESISTAHSTT